MNLEVIVVPGAGLEAALALSSSWKRGSFWIS